MSIRASLLVSLEPPLPERDCKGTTFFFPSKSFRNFFPTFFRAGHRRQARQTAEPPVWHAVARLRPQVGFFPVPGEKDCRPHRQANARRRNRGTGGTQSKGCRGCQSGKRLTSGRVGTVSLRRILALQRDPAPRAMPTLWRMSALHRKEDLTVRSGPPAR